ncbi:type II secretion system F family protein [Arthrobacter sp. NamB2]|nr:type II secretion system F family protein [Arthrobacter sp. NamB2]
MTGLLVSFLLACAAIVLDARSAGVKRPAVRPRSAVSQRGLREAPLILDLLGALLTGGASVEYALSVVAASCDPTMGFLLQRVHAARLLGASWNAAWDAGLDAHHHRLPQRRRGLPRMIALTDQAVRSAEEVRQGLRFATSTGAPSAALLHAHAAQLRRRHNREMERKAAALGVQLVLPLGLCSLPAFICLGVVPVVLGLLPAL